MLNVSKFKKIKILGITIFSVIFLIGIAFSPFFFKKSFVLSSIFSESKEKKFDFLDTEQKNELVEADSESLKSGLLVQKAIANVAKSVYQSVVNIRSEMDKSNSKNSFQEFFEFFDEPFRNHPRKPKKSETLGSGFLITNDGYILTNYHVIKDALNIKILLHNEYEYDAKIIGKDDKSDIAVIKIDPSKNDLVPIPLGDSDDVKIGDLSIAIGNPFGIFSGTFTLGIISAKGRNHLNGDMEAGYKNYIQTDTPINRGNSGGPLLNIKGQVIGMNTAMYSTTAGSYIGIGFAIPINIVKFVSKNLIEVGVVRRVELGITILEISDNFAEHLKLKNKNGCLVNQINSKSPAEKAGFKELDIIVKYDNNEIKNCNQLKALVSNEKGERESQITVLRENKPLVLKVNLKYQEITKLKSDNGLESSNLKSLIGMQFADLKNYLDSNNNIPNLGLYKSVKNGIVIVAVDNNSEAAKYAAPGDVVEMINQVSINNMNDLVNFIKDNEKTKSFLFKVKRIYQNQFATYYYVIKKY